MKQNTGNPFESTYDVNPLTVDDSPLPKDVNTIKEIVEWVGDSEDRAILVLEHEENSDTPRKTLIEKLESVVNG